MEPSHLKAELNDYEASNVNILVQNNSSQQMVEENDMAQPYAQVLNINTGKLYEISRAAEIAGRDIDARIIFTDLCVSRIQCIFEKQENNRCLLKSSGRALVVSVNNKPLRRGTYIELSQGDIISIFDQMYIFYYTDKNPNDTILAYLQSTSDVIESEVESIGSTLAVGGAEVPNKCDNDIVQELSRKLLETEREKDELLKHNQGLKRKAKDYAKIVKKLRQEKVKEVQEIHKKNDLQKEKLMENLECGICTELCLQTSFLQCGHQFCKNCIASWKKKKKDCPVCRVRIATEVRAYNVDKVIEQHCSTLPEEEQQRRKDLIGQRTKVPKKKAKLSYRFTTQGNRAQRMQAIAAPTPEDEFNFDIHVAQVVHRVNSRLVSTATAGESGFAVDLTFTPRTTSSTIPVLFARNVDVTTALTPAMLYNDSNRATVIDLTQSPSR